MNRIAATVTAVECVDNITVVSFEAAGQKMRMMALALNTPLKAGSRVLLGVKASHVSLAKELDGVLSISNRLQVTVETVNSGALLASVKARFADTLIESIITRESAERMNLLPGDRVTALIKASELSILSVDSDTPQ